MSGMINIFEHIKETVGELKIAGLEKTIPSLLRIITNKETGRIIRQTIHAQHITDEAYRFLTKLIEIEKPKPSHMSFNSTISYKGKIYIIELYKGYGKIEAPGATFAIIDKLEEIK